MTRNRVGSIYGRSFVKIAHFVPIRYQTWRRRFLEIDQSKQELPVAAILVNGSGQNEQSL
jgi:hypothetical protein